MPYLPLSTCRGGASWRLFGSKQLEAVRVRVALVDEDRVEPRQPGPAGDAGDDRLVLTDAHQPFDPTFEQAADDALVHELVADAEFPAGRELGETRRGAGAAWRAVDGLLAIEDGIAAVCLRRAHRPRPHDMRDAADGRILGVGDLDLLVQAAPQDRAQALDVEGGDVVEPAVAR